MWTLITSIKVKISVDSNHVDKSKIRVDSNRGLNGLDKISDAFLGNYNHGWGNPIKRQVTQTTASVNKSPLLVAVASDLDYVTPWTRSLLLLKSPGTSRGDNQVVCYQYVSLTSMLRNI